jgi:hypothetical protein
MKKTFHKKIVFLSLSFLAYDEPKKMLKKEL